MSHGVQMQLEKGLWFNNLKRACDKELRTKNTEKNKIRKKARVGKINLLKPCLVAHKKNIYKTLTIFTANIVLLEI